MAALRRRVPCPGAHRVCWCPVLCGGMHDAWGDRSTPYARLAIPPPAGSSEPNSHRSKCSQRHPRLCGFRWSQPSHLTTNYWLPQEGHRSARVLVPYSACYSSVAADYNEMVRKYTDDHSRFLKVIPITAADLSRRITGGLVEQMTLRACFPNRSEQLICQTEFAESAEGRLSRCLTMSRLCYIKSHTGKSGLWTVHGGAIGWM